MIAIRNKLPIAVEHRILKLSREHGRWIVESKLTVELHALAGSRVHPGQSFVMQSPDRYQPRFGSWSCRTLAIGSAQSIPAR
jgi:hypothetical protein